MPPSPSDDVIIRPRAPAHYRMALVVAVLAVMAIMLYAAYHYGKIGSARALARSQQAVAELNRELTGLRERLVAIQGSLARAERQLQIDKAAYAELGGELRASTDQLASLHHELKFYRSIISPQDGGAGIRFHEFSVVETGEPRVFTYRLVLIQALQHSKNVEGAVTLEITGIRGGEAAFVSVPAAGGESIKVKFKYFQNLKGRIELPPDFVPQEVKVELRPVKKKNKQAEAIERAYRWSEIIG